MNKPYARKMIIVLVAGIALNGAVETVSSSKTNGLLTVTRNRQETRNPDGSREKIDIRRTFDRSTSLPTVLQEQRIQTRDAFGNQTETREVTPAVG